MENMTVATRIVNIRLLELMKKQPEYAKQMGLVDVSHYKDESVTDKSSGESRKVYMSEIKCPHCGQVFTVDESEYQAIVS